MNAATILRSLILGVGIEVPDTVLLRADKVIR